jgi:hypothetical protein
MRFTADPITAATVVIAAATVLNVFASLALWISTRSSVGIARLVFEAANRPYLGLDSWTIRNDPVQKTLDFEANMKNFGTAAAEEEISEWELRINGEKVPVTEWHQNPSTVFPGHSFQLKAGCIGPAYDNLVSGRSVLEGFIRLRYKGPGNKDYVYCEKFRYHPERESFINLGRCQD